MLNTLSSEPLYEPSTRTHDSGSTPACDPYVRDSEVTVVLRIEAEGAWEVVAVCGVC
jgi:hypothetical protein